MATHRPVVIVSLILEQDADKIVSKLVRVGYRVTAIDNKLCYFDPDKVGALCTIIVESDPDSSKNLKPCKGNVYDEFFEYIVKILNESDIKYTSLVTVWGDVNCMRFGGSNTPREINEKAKTAYRD